MQSNAIMFSPYEYEVMQDAGFMLARQRIMEKMGGYYGGFQAKAEESLSDDVVRLENKFSITFQSPKISRGENYCGLPYMVLDHPKYIDKDAILTFRSMFWWGNFFSFTVHLQGKIWKEAQLNLPADLPLIYDLYMSNGDNPWEYHYEPDNYELLTRENMHQLLEARKNEEFIKLSVKYPLGTPLPELLKEGIDFYKTMAKVL